MHTSYRSERLVSLDFFRGAAIVLMILVNNPGSWAHVYPPLLHARWHGWTPTDLVFPFFLFIVGVAIVLAYTKRLSKGAPKSELAKKAVSRTVVLFALGLFMAAWPFFTFDPEFAVRPAMFKLRYMGVLQRIALSYLAASMIFLYAGPKARKYWIVGLLVGYWLAMALIPVPGYGAGMWDDPVTTLSAYLDRMILGVNHLWAGTGRTWDPEGLLSTIPAIATTLLGVWTGELLAGSDDNSTKVARLMVRGAILVGIGYVWNWFFPINKGIWTSSYAVFTGGLAMSALGVSYWLVDVKGYKKWTQPFVVYGMNALTVFFLSGIVAKSLIILKVNGPNGDLISVYSWIYQTIFLPLASPVNASLMFALTWILFWYLVLAAMWKRGIVIKV
ncbi:MAG: acyltransferase family protein [Rhodothermia bacterium]